MKSLSLFLYVLLFSSYAAIAAEYKIQPTESIIAIITKKAGVGATFAHNHIVYPSKYESSLTLDEDMSRADFSLSFKVADLEVDDPTIKNRYSDDAVKLGILSEPFQETSSSNRQSIHKSMLGHSQLDAENFPVIEASASNFRKNPLFPDKHPYSHMCDLTFTVHGITQTRTFPVGLIFEGDLVQAESHGSFNFTDFDIEPFSAFLGAVKNQNKFHVFIKIKALKISE